jgi:O-antigen/teichoic acid export membrane protein
MKSLFKLGAGFFVLQICYAFAFTSDNLIVAQILGQQAVAEYAIVTRLFAIVPMLAEMCLGPLWPAYGEAIARSDIDWIKRTFRHTLVLAGVIGLSSAIVLVAFGNQIINVWIGSTTSVPILLLFAFAIWMSLSVGGSAVAMLLNGTGQLKFQVICGLAIAIVAPALKTLIGLRMGLAGVVLGTALAYFVCVAIPMAFYVPVLLQRLKHPANSTDTSGTL